MNEGTRLAVWQAVGRATERVGGTHVSGFLGESYAIPDVAWAGFPAVLTAELGADWEVAPGGQSDPYCMVVQGPDGAFLLKSTRVTTHGGVARRLVLEEE